MMLDWRPWQSPGGGSGFRRLTGALIAAVCLLGASGARAHERVLLLFSHDRLLPANIEIEKGFREALAERAEPVEVSAEFLDIVHFPDQAQQQAFMRFLNERYATHAPDLVVVFGPQSHAVLAAHRQQLFPDKPVVIGAVDAGRIDSEPHLPNTVVQPAEWTVAPILRELPKCRPDLRKVLLVAGDAPFDHQRFESAMAAVTETGTPLEVSASVGEDLDTVRRKVASLPGDTVVLFLSYFLTPDGTATIPRDVGNDLAKAASVPVLGAYDTFLGDGMTGVCAVPFRDEGLAIGKTALRLLDGEQADDIGILPSTEPRFIFDDRQLRRWDWKARDLPPDTEIRYQQPSLWESHRTLVLVSGAVLLVQSALIAGLILARRRQKRIQSRLIRSEGRFAGIFRGSPTATAIIRGADGSIVDINPAWETVTGRTRAESLGRNPQEVGFIIEGDAEQRLREFLGSGRPLREFEQRLRTADGSERLLSLTTERIELHGEPCHVVMATDITGRREAAEARRQLARTSRLSMLGEMTASIAHEVNQPLGAILSNADAAELLLGRPDPPLDSVRQILSDIRRDDLRASDVIKRVRRLVQRGESAPGPVDPNELVTQTALLLDDGLRRRGIEVDFTLEDGLPSIHADRGQLEQVILNLIMNAMDAMKDIPVARRRLELRTAREGPDHLRITVGDRGTGIDPGHLDRIFQSFFSTKSDGMGLGLALSRSIAELHGGSIHAENNPSGGAGFHLVLPLGNHPVA